MRKRQDKTAERLEVIAALYEAAVAPEAWRHALGPAAGAIVALPSRSLAPGSRPVGLGVFYTAYYVLMALGLAMAGRFERMTAKARPSLQAA